jgi:hypothetical protein
MNRTQRTLPALLLIFFTCFQMDAQTAMPIPHELLAGIVPGASLGSLLDRFGSETTTWGKLVPVRKISKSMNVWLFRLDTSAITAEVALEWMRRQPEVGLAQYNFEWNTRQPQSVENILPNDPLIGQQWQYVNTGVNGGVFDADLDADQAWDISTGGVTPAGDTIVIAVIDAGVQFSHPDLAPNLWHNRDEIPNDGIDNDQNGYVDDYRGWNTVTGNDNIEGSGTTHGTPVSAIIGAKGDNGIGIAGVNWNVKMMFVAGGSTLADILESFDYVVQARQRYNVTNGAAGAFVVAVNCSWGINNGHPSDAPLWCAALDTLGYAGILSIAATANAAVNVDEVGDLPTTCQSDYLIAVTSLDKKDLKAVNAAWGVVNIDLGAYGDGVYTAGAAGSYGNFSGTSFATPHVSGAVGLLYASPCPGLIALAKTQPAAAASWVKSLIINNTTPIPSLNGITLSGGRLNLYNPLKAYQDQCSPCQAPFALVVKNITKNSAKLEWLGTADYQFVRMRWRKQGTGTWTVVDNATAPYLLTELTPCTGYEFQAISFCGQGLYSPWSEPFAFKTDGCCAPPPDVAVTTISNTQATISWHRISAANHYIVRSRKPGDSWMMHVVSDTTITLLNLNPCSQYEIQVQTNCSGGLFTDFSNSLFFTTSGCGACLDVNYCQAAGQVALSEWIGLFKLDTFTLSNNWQPGNGFQNFTGVSSLIPILSAGESYPVSIKPGFPGTPRKEYVRLYIDVNGDGIFTPDELRFDPGFASADLQTGQLKIPDNAAPGLTRMRLLMKFTNDPAQAPNPCETFAFGQVQDYCVYLRTPVTASDAPPGASNDIRIFPNPATDLVSVERSGLTEQVCLQIWGTDGRLRYQNRALLPMIFTVNNWPSGIYFVRITSGDTAGKSYFGLLTKP